MFSLQWYINVLYMPLDLHTIVNLPLCLLRKNSARWLLRRCWGGISCLKSVPKPAGWCGCSWVLICIGSFFYRIPHGGTLPPLRVTIAKKLADNGVIPRLLLCALCVKILSRAWQCKKCVLHSWLLSRWGGTGCLFEFKWIYYGRM